MRTNPKGFLAAFVVVSVAMSVATLAVNLIVDPYRRFDLVEIKGINGQRFAANSRLGKAGALCRIKPVQVVLGTSRVVVGIDPLHPGFADLPGPVYNGAIAGSGLHEIDLTMRHAVHASPGLKRILVGLDFLMFNAHREAAAYGTEVVDFDEARLLLSGHDTCARAFLYDFDRLLGIRGLRSSQGSLRRQMSEPKTTSDDVAGWISLTDGYGFQRNFSVLEKTHVPSGGYRGMFGDAQERYYAQKIWRAGPEQRYCFSREGQSNTVDVFRGMVRFARASGADVRFFVNPIHARMLIAIREAGLWPQYEDWKRSLVEVLQAEAAESGKPQFPLWDFSGFNSVTTEKVPPDGDTKTVLHGFWEPSHYKREAGDLILDRVLGYRDPHRTLPADFGVALTPANIGDWIERTRAGAAAYIKAERREVALVEKIVGEVMADAEGANCGTDVAAAQAGAAALARGDKAGAETLFARAVTLHEEDRRRYAALGVAYRETGFEKALARAREGHVAAPLLLSWEEYQTRGMERQKKGDYNGAVDDFGTAIRIGPTNTALYFLRGTALMQAGRPSSAIADLKKGLELEPTNPTLRQLLQQASAAHDKP